MPTEHRQEVKAFSTCRLLRSISKEIDLHQNPSPSTDRDGDAARTEETLVGDKLHQVRPQPTDHTTTSNPDPTTTPLHSTLVGTKIERDPQAYPDHGLFGSWESQATPANFLSPRTCQLWKVTTPTSVRPPGLPRPRTFGSWESQARPANFFFRWACQLWKVTTSATRLRSEQDRSSRTPGLPRPRYFWLLRIASDTRKLFFSRGLVSFRSEISHVRVRPPGLPRPRTFWLLRIASDTRKLFFSMDLSALKGHNTNPPPSIQHTHFVSTRANLLGFDRNKTF